MQRTDRIRGYDSRCRPFELKGAVTPSLLHGLTQQDRVVEHQADGPDPATTDECLWISPVAGHTHDADLLIDVLERPRPFGVVKIRIHPALRDRIVDRETMLPAGRQLRQRVNAPAEMRRVVDVAVLDD